MSQTISSAKRQIASGVSLPCGMDDSSGLLEVQIDKKHTETSENMLPRTSLPRSASQPL